MKKSSIILIIIALFPFLSYAQDTKPLITLSTTTVSPDNDDDGEPIEELAITLHLGAAKSTPIRIDWGDGNLLDYTIGSSEPKRTDDYRQQNIGTQYRSVPTSTGTILRLQQPQQSDTQQ